jgi:mannose/fructose/N-acetylgalactosamine-specific phosphotransferase system component IIC
MALLPPSSIENGNTNKPNKETAPKPGKKGLRIVGNVLVGLAVGFAVVVAVFIISYAGHQN